MQMTSGIGFSGARRQIENIVFTPLRGERGNEKEGERNMNYSPSGGRNDEERDGEKRAREKEKEGAREMV